MKIGKMKKLFIIFVTLFLSLSILYADDYQEPITLKTDITGVGSYKNFGLGLAPVSTTFEYYRTDLDWFELSKFKSQFYFNITYGFAETSDNNREWDTGQPAWALTVHDKNKISSKFSSGTYFRQYGAMELRFEQPFIDNPIEGSEQKYLFEFKFGLNMRYTNISERLSLGSDASPTFVDINGNPKGIYAEAGVGNPIIAWPWLNGNRKTLSNYMFASLYFYPYREVRESVQDGVYGYVTFEYGPKWLLNSISPKNYTSADYYRIYAYLEEKLVLLDDRQDNNWNWFAIYFGHSNTFNHVGGDVVPYYKMISNYFSNQLTDKFWLHFMGPNFIAKDCFTYMELSLTNNFYFGEVVNATQIYEGISYTGALGVKLHLRLFGFIRFDYDCSYNFAGGISASNPAWSQKATLQFSIAV